MYYLWFLEWFCMPVCMLYPFSWGWINSTIFSVRLDMYNVICMFLFKGTCRSYSKSSVYFRWVSVWYLSSFKYTLLLSCPFSAMCMFLIHVYFHSQNMVWYVDHAYSLVFTYICYFLALMCSSFCINHVTYM